MRMIYIYFQMSESSQSSSGSERVNNRDDRNSRGREKDKVMMYSSEKLIILEDSVYLYI